MSDKPTVKQLDLSELPENQEVSQEDVACQEKTQKLKNQIALKKEWDADPRGKILEGKSEEKQLSIMMSKYQFAHSRPDWYKLAFAGFLLYLKYSHVLDGVMKSLENESSFNIMGGMISSVLESTLFVFFNMLEMLIVGCFMFFPPLVILGIPTEIRFNELVTALKLYPPAGEKLFSVIIKWSEIERVEFQQHFKGDYLVLWSHADTVLGEMDLSFSKRKMKRLLMLIRSNVNINHPLRNFMEGYCSK